MKENRAEPGLFCLPVGCRIVLLKYLWQHRDMVEISYILIENVSNINIILW